MLLWAVADGVGCEEETMPLPALPVNQSESVFTTYAGFKRGEGGGIEVCARQHAFEQLVLRGSSGWLALE